MINAASNNGQSPVQPIGTCRHQRRELASILPVELNQHARLASSSAQSGLELDSKLQLPSTRCLELGSIYREEQPKHARVESNCWSNYSLQWFVYCFSAKWHNNLYRKVCVGSEGGVRNFVAFCKATFFSLCSSFDNGTASFLTSNER